MRDPADEGRTHEMTLPGGSGARIGYARVSTPEQDIAGVLKTSVADLLSEASACPTDQAIRISAWLESLPPEDGEFVIGQVKALCDHMRHVRLATMKGKP